MRQQLAQQGDLETHLESQCRCGFAYKPMMDKATVIIPCYNVEAYILRLPGLRGAPGGVVHHTYVVDNNSTDDTIKKVREWQKSNPNFPYTVV